MRLEINYILRHTNQQYYKYSGKPDGYDLMERDWDTAVILDACRYDYFDEEYEQYIQQGGLKKETSPGSESQEFMIKSFKNRELHDTVYITGNPYVTLLDPDVFHAVQLDEAWGDDTSEVPPQKITDQAISAHTEYPNKRIIVHYMTPHLPFVCQNDNQLNHEVSDWRGMYWPEDTTRDKIQTGYRNNVRVVLNEVRELLEYIDGKVVITSDHGELLGGRIRPIPVRGYDHFPSLYVPELINVPWLEIDSSDRRDIQAEAPQDELSVDEKTKDERLRALGYL